MKLLIDIPKEKYEWIKKNNPNADTNSIVGAIANGMPIETATNEEETQVNQLERKFRSMISNELKNDLRKKICQINGIHNFVPYKPGTMICEGCGILAKVGAMYMKTGDPEHLIIDKKEGET